jgi:hypothetical protein
MSRLSSAHPCSTDFREIIHDGSGNLLDPLPTGAKDQLPDWHGCSHTTKHLELLSAL